MYAGATIAAGTEGEVGGTLCASDTYEVISLLWASLLIHLLVFIFKILF